MCVARYMRCNTPFSPPLCSDSHPRRITHLQMSEKNIKYLENFEVKGDGAAPPQRVADTVEGRAFSSGFEVETTESAIALWVGRRT